MIPTPDSPIGTAAFLVLGMTIAGIFHVVWLMSAPADRWRDPVDLGLTLRGRRLFGANKMWRGFVVLAPACALVFVVLHAVKDYLPEWIGSGMWEMTATQYAGLGFVCGLSFMLAELPNSFVKRQLDVAPGKPPASSVLKGVFLLVDRCDSVIGVLIAASLLVPVPWVTWFVTICIGLLIHALFSALLHLVGIKERAL